MEQEKMDGLPEGWKIEKLRNIWEVIRWVSYKKEQLLSGPDGAVSLMRANNIGDQVDLTELQYIPFDAIKPRQLARDWDSLICMSSGSHHLVGKSVMLRGLENFTFGAFCGIFRPSGERLLPGYASYYLRSENVRRKLASLWNGAWISNIKPSDIGDLEMPLPPLAEQERIVAKLDGIFEHIDASIKLLEQNIADVAVMAESVLSESFIGDESSWNWITEKLWNPDIVTLIMGQSPDSKSYNTKMEWLPFFQGKKEFWELYPVVEIWCSEPKKIAEAWDVLLSVRAPVGPTNICLEKSCIGRWLWAIRANPKKLNSKFLLHFFRAFESKLAEYGKWSTFPAITKKELEGFEIPLPPLPEQERIVAKLDEFFVEQKAIKSGYETKISELKALKSSILSSAFRGEV